MGFLRRVRFPKAPVIAFAREWGKLTGINYMALKAMNQEAADRDIFMMIIERLLKMKRAAEYADMHANLREAAATAPNLAEFIGAVVGIYYSATIVAWAEEDSAARTAFMQEIFAAVQQGLQEATLEMERRTQD